MPTFFYYFVRKIKKLIIYINIGFFRKSGQKWAKSEKMVIFGKNEEKWLFFGKNGKNVYGRRKKVQNCTEL